MKTVGIISLGCCKNLVDSENILGILNNKNVIFSNKISTCDLIIINTCGFIESAKQEAIDTIDECLSKRKENAKIMVIGCYAQRYKEKLIDIYNDQIDAIVSINEYKDIKNILENLLDLDLEKEYNHVDKLYLTNPYFSYIKIAEGCKNNCSYCAIPLIRGTLVSFPKEEIFRQVQNSLQLGRNEIVLIAQDTTAYGYDFDYNYKLADLLKDILNIKGIKSIRLLYLYPDEVSDELIELISNNDIIVPYFDLPLQHINNRILKDMNRRGSKEEIIQLIKKIRSKIKNSIIRTTFIVGYPGETEEEFNELLDFIKEYPFDLLGAFTYSKEENTKAYNKEQIKEEIKEKRLETLMSVQEEISLSLNQKRIGDVYKVRVELYNPLKRIYRGFSYMSAPDNIDGYVYFTSEEKLERYSEVDVKIIDANSHDLIGVKI